MSLIYALAARGSVVLAEYSGFQGNFSTIAIKYLDKLQNTPRATFTSDHFSFTYIVADGFTFCVVADEDAGKSLPDGALTKLKNEFLSQFAVKGQNAGDRGLSKEFGPKIKDVLTYVMNNPNEFNKVATVQKKVDEVKAIMVENIDKVLERGERLENLVDKTDNLRFQADKFQKQGRTLRNKMWWQNIKMKLIVVSLILIVILVIFLLICFGMTKCFEKKAAAPAPSNTTPTARRLLTVAGQGSSSQKQGGDLMGFLLA